jgi:2'-5' RNA ligase
MALSVCLLLDDQADRAVRALWQRLERAGVPTLQTHTHGHHVPHLTFASLRSYDLGDVRAVLASLPVQEPVSLCFDALGMFRRSRCWLGLAASSELVVRQRTVASTLRTSGAELHRNYEPGSWVPHLTLAPRLHLDQLPTIARQTFEVLPLEATLTRAVLVDTATGEVLALPHLL